MGYFTEGYQVGEKVVKNEITTEQYEEELKNMIGKGNYNECREWYYGFHNAMLDFDLSNLQKAFMVLKQESEKKD